MVTLEVFIVGARQGDIEAHVSASGFRSVALGLTELATLAHPASRQPDVVIVDLRGRRDLPPGLAALKRQHPGTGVVLVASALEPALMLEAMRAGVSECVTEPLKAAEIEAAMLRLAATRPAVAVSGQIVAFVGAKGGVGTTVTVVNVATALAGLKGDRVLLIDLHPTHGDAALLFGAEPRFSVVDALESIHRLDDTFLRSLVTTTKAGPHLLASSDRAVAAPPVVDQVRALVDFAAGQYRHVLLDIGRTEAAALDALDQASRIVVVTTQELSSVQCASRMAGALRQRYGRERVKALVTRYDYNADIGQDDVGRAMGVPVLTALPSNYRLVLESLNRGRPLMLENHSRLAAGYRKLACDLAGLEPEKPKTEAAGGLLGLLAGRR